MGLDITINDEAVAIDTSGFTTISELVTAVSNANISDIELIESISINNEIVPSESYETTGNKDLSGINSISIKTIEDPAFQAIGLLDRMELYLEAFTQGSTEVADKFRTGMVEKANSLLLEVIEGLTALEELITAVKAICDKPLDELESDGETFKVREESLNKILNEIHLNQEAEDWLAVADLLEYELAPEVKMWKDFLPLLKVEISGPDTN